MEVLTYTNVAKTQKSRNRSKMINIEGGLATTSLHIRLSSIPVLWSDIGDHVHCTGWCSMGDHMYRHAVQMGIDQTNDRTCTVTDNRELRWAQNLFTLEI